MTTTQTARAVEPDALDADGTARFGGHIEADAGARHPIYTGLRTWVTITDAEEYAADLQRAIAWAKQQEARR